MANSFESNLKSSARRVSGQLGDAAAEAVKVCVTCTALSFVSDELATKHLVSGVRRVLEKAAPRSPEFRNFLLEMLEERLIDEGLSEERS